eukprot:TRINITY_DN682_c0_g1_i1.p1 TRINITY_DN682_c0_g1~~TRINITY_DN682_c0_g1_i1.p1  ORF type:complete len:623 (+),score=165.56 TRINITY_DN682_c0_g1_i1:547-2415(+)
MTQVYQNKSFNCQKFDWAMNIPYGCPCIFTNESILCDNVIFDKNGSRLIDELNGKQILNIFKNENEIYYNCVSFDPSNIDTIFCTKDFIKFKSIPNKLFALPTHNGVKYLVNSNNFLQLLIDDEKKLDLNLPAFVFSFNHFFSNDFTIFNINNTIFKFKNYDEIEIISTKFNTISILDDFLMFCNQQQKVYSINNTDIEFIDKKVFQVIHHCYDRQYIALMALDQIKMCLIDCEKNEYKEIAKFDLMDLPVSFCSNADNLFIVCQSNNVKKIPFILIDKIKWKTCDFVNSLKSANIIENFEGCQAFKVKYAGQMYDCCIPLSDKHFKIVSSFSDSSNLCENFKVGQPLVFQRNNGEKITYVGSFLHQTSDMTIDLAVFCEGMSSVFEVDLSLFKVNKIETFVCETLENIKTFQNHNVLNFEDFCIVSMDSFHANDRLFCRVLTLDDRVDTPKFSAIKEGKWCVLKDQKYPTIANEMYCSFCFFDEPLPISFYDKPDHKNMLGDVHYGWRMLKYPIKVNSTGKILISTDVNFLTAYSDIIFETKNNTRNIVCSNPFDKMIALKIDLLMEFSTFIFHSGCCLDVKGVETFVDTKDGDALSIWAYVWFDEDENVGAVRFGHNLAN